MGDAIDIYARIGALIAESGQPPTPSTYEFWYRYVTGADPQLIEAVDAVRGDGKPVTGKAMATIRAELWGDTRFNPVQALLDGAQQQIAQLSAYVKESEGETRDYKSVLVDGTRSLEAPTTIEQQRAMLADILLATNAMLGKTARMEEQLAASASEIRALKVELENAKSENGIDPLTGLANRKACGAYLDAQIERARKERAPLSLIFLDIDHFKLFNDNFGHRMGDEVLRLVGASLEKFFHGAGLPARYGGEEFLIVLPGHDAELAADIADRFRVFVATRTVRARHTNREVGRITLSLGVAQMRRGEDAGALVERADKALYRAKSEGRNRVCVSSDGRRAA